VLESTYVFMYVCVCVLKVGEDVAAVRNDQGPACMLLLHYVITCACALVLMLRICVHDRVHACVCVFVCVCVCVCEREREREGNV